MILFFDRNVGTVVPKILQWKNLRFPIQVEYHQQHFPIDEKDDVWLSTVGQWGWTVIGHDSSFHLRPTELSAIKQFQIGCFYLWGSEATRWEKLRCFSRAYDRIVQAEANTHKPFIFTITPTGLLHEVPIP